MPLFPCGAERAGKTVAHSDPATSAESINDLNLRSWRFGRKVHQAPLRAELLQDRRDERVGARLRYAESNEVRGEKHSAAA